MRDDVSNIHTTSLSRSNADQNIVKQSTSNFCRGPDMKNTNNYLPLPGDEQQWYMADLLQQRLNSLNKLVRRRESLTGIGNPDLIAEAGSKLKEQQQEADVDVGIENLGCPHPLSERNPDLPQTDASRRLSLRFDDYQDGINCESPNKIKNHGSNRVVINVRERRKKSIQILEKQLQSNSSKYLSRAANSIRFHVKKVPSESHLNERSKMTEVEEYPIPLGGFEMNPDLLLSLSCEKMALNHGRGLLKTVSLNPISLDLFVYMYWFIHCRFFQKHSGSEQRYLLGKVAGCFPSFIKLLASIAPPKQRDTLFRHYPFVLSKAIYLAFQFLCPGNQSLFKGPFLRILYLSVFRLLTGVDICPESVDALRLKLFPEDYSKDDSGCDERDQETSNRLSPLPNRRSKDHHKMREVDNDFGEANYGNKRTRNVNGQALHDKRRNLMRNHLAMARTSPTRSSVVKFVGERETLCFHHEKPVSLGCKYLLRQQQVNFDVNQISPLLQQCLGREGISKRPKQFIKRTEPVRFCRTGGIETFQKRYDEDVEKVEEDLMRHHSEAKRDLKTDIKQNDTELLKARSAIACEKMEALRTKDTKEEAASKIISNLGQRKQCQSS